MVTLHRVRLKVHVILAGPDAVKHFISHFLQNTGMGRLHALGSACFSVPVALQNRTDTGMWGTDTGCSNPNPAGHRHNEA